jgi:hypothetical protein
VLVLRTSRKLIICESFHSKRACVWTCEKRSYHEKEVFCTFLHSIMRRAIVALALVLTPQLAAAQTPTLFDSAMDAPSLSLLPERARHGSLAEHFAPVPVPVVASASKQYWLTVPLDYDRPILGPKFKIRYFVDDTYFDSTNSSAPIFVGMGGEGGTSGASCISFRSTAVIDHKALCVGVEHRFYGESVPETGGLSTSNYELGLSVEANLHDTAAVIKAVQDQYSPRGHPRPVMNFGGSYSGATCAWFRQRYPDSTAGCVSSSGVVNAILPFAQFDSHVADAIGTDCASALRAAQQAVDAKFDAGKGAEVKGLFNASNLVGAIHGDTDFMYAIADGPAMLDQYGRKATLCSGLARLPPKPSDDQRIANLADIIAKHYGPKFVSDCFYDTNCFANASATGSGALGTTGNARSWRWQKCSELAYLQLSPARGGKTALRSPRLTLDALLRQCDAAFGEGTSLKLRARNAKFNAQYGGADPRTAALPVAAATSIFYLDFSDDPWAEASVRHSLGPPSLALSYCMTTCDGCGHCGAGVPANLTRCDEAADAFVGKVLRGWARGHRGTAEHAAMP